MFSVRAMTLWSIAMDEDQTSISSTHVVAHNLFPGDLMASSGTPQTVGIHTAHRHTWMQNTHTHKFFSKKR